MPPKRLSLARIGLLVGLFALAIAVYLPGLSGPFLFDDHVHITKNAALHIDDLGPPALTQAWHSSPMRFPGNRPLAQLSFGINHALAGLSPLAFKATNLAIHLICGALVFLLAQRLALLHLRPGTAGDHAADAVVRARWVAGLCAAVWLLTPLNLTGVLYVVQRMATLSALFVLLGLWLYVEGRARIREGQGSGFWLMLAAWPAAAIGFLGKENAVLLPVFLFAIEWTLPRHQGAVGQVLERRARWLAAAFIALPLLAGVTYLLQHGGYLGYGTRHFDMTERLWTQARALWFYLSLLAVPDPSRMGLYLDGFVISRGWWQPWTTTPAVLGILALAAAALTLARRWPVPAFAVLFFLAGHALESSIFPLEPVYEHRNYLAAIGPCFLLAWLLVVTPRPQSRRLFLGLGLTLVAAHAMATHLRARDWSSLESFVAAEVQHQPDSPRANFHAAQTLISQLSAHPDPAAAAAAASHYLARIRELDPRNLDALFAGIVLDLHLNRQPDPALVDDLITGLREHRLGPMQLTTGQFGFLVRWHLGGGHPLAEDVMHAIFTNALENRHLDRYARAGILSAYRAYLDRVLQRPLEALPYARRATETWAQHWHYHHRLIELLLKLGRPDEAAAALVTARQALGPKLPLDEAATWAQRIARAAQVKAGTEAEDPGDRRQNDDLETRAQTTGKDDT